ncbi:MAG: hypothetical protein AAB608_01335 [Patescibacteria group bacterium]
MPTLTLTFSDPHTFRATLFKEGDGVVSAETHIAVTRTFDTDIVQGMRAFFEAHAIDPKSLDIELNAGLLDKNTLPYRMAYTWKSAIESLKAREAAT